MAGYFNAKALEQGSEWPDSRSRDIMEVVSRLGLIVLNDGETSTFRTPGYRETIVDVSFATDRLAPRVQD